MERAAEMPRPRRARAETKIENLRREAAVEHDVGWLEVAVLDAERVRAANRVADVAQHLRLLPAFEGRPDAAELEAVDVLHDDHGGSASTRTSKI